MGGGELHVRPHAAVAKAPHVQSQFRWLFDLHYLCEWGRKPKAAVRRPAQLDDELQWLVPDVAFIRVLDGQGSRDQDAASPSSTPNTTTGTSASSPTSPCGGLRLCVPSRRREALSSKNPRRHRRSTTAPTSPRHCGEMVPEGRRKEWCGSAPRHVPFYRRVGPRAGSSPRKQPPRFTGVIPLCH